MAKSGRSSVACHTTPATAASEFRAAFPERRRRIDMTGIAMALGSFQRSMESFDAPADRSVLSNTGQAGKVLFGRTRASCHAGADFTGGRFHAVLPVDGADCRPAEVTGRTEDEGRFRTPPLRNVAVTGPWFHDGSARTLREAIARHPVTLDVPATDQLVAFPEALTDRGSIKNPAVAYTDRPCGKE